MNQKADVTTKLSYEANIKSSNKKTVILEQVYGSVCTGEVTGVMGPSGAGKSSLFDFLSKQYSKTKVMNGKIFINNEEMSINYLNQHLSYKSQFTPSLSKLKVIEHIKFQLCMENIKITKETLEYIDKTLLAYDMLDKKQSLLNTLSSGEMERISTISSVLLGMPFQLYDEPLSNLDVCTAHRMLEDLRNTAKNDNKAIVITIHQPNPETLSYFDRLMVLSKHGVIYHSKTKEYPEYFEKNFNVSVTTAEDLIELCYIIDNNVLLREKILETCKKNFILEQESQKNIEYEPLPVLRKRPKIKFMISYYLFINLWRVFKSNFSNLKLYSLITQVITVLIALVSYLVNLYIKDENDNIFTLICWCFYVALHYITFDKPIVENIKEDKISKFVKNNDPLMFIYNINDVFLKIVLHEFLQNKDFSIEEIKNLSELDKISIARFFLLLIDSFEKIKKRFKGIPSKEDLSSITVYDFVPETTNSKVKLSNLTIKDLIFEETKISDIFENKYFKKMRNFIRKELPLIDIFEKLGIEENFKLADLKAPELLLSECRSPDIRFIYITNFINYLKNDNLIMVFAFFIIFIVISFMVLRINSYFLDLIDFDKNIIHTLFYYVKNSRINLFEMIFYMTISIAPFALIPNFILFIPLFGIFYNRSFLNLHLVIFISIMSLGFTLLKSEFYTSLFELLFYINPDVFLLFKYFKYFIVITGSLVFTKFSYNIDDYFTLRNDFKVSDIFEKCTLFIAEILIKRLILPFIIKDYKGMFLMLMPFVLEFLIAFFILPVLFYFII
ncbi:ABCGC [Hepatospora eriocheir]|uniref:ABCGC n=1 Tax=Hepatospora eriocheir TaxID=1081669 RepID=A0A1X0Q8F5_9MICR|nr:ABCGC [Hepatospora eriocheir]